MNAQQIAETAWLAAGIYVALGVLVAIILHASLLVKMDSRVKGAGIGFRLLITPGLILLWPVMLMKAFGGKPADPS